MDHLHSPDMVPCRWPEHLLDEPLPHVVLNRAMIAARCRCAMKNDGEVRLYLDDRSLPAAEAAAAVRAELAELGVIVEEVSGTELAYRIPKTAHAAVPHAADLAEPVRMPA